MLDELSILLEAVTDAGQEILNIQNSGIIVSKKGKSDIVTQADHVVNEILQERLIRRFSQYGWLSEESVDDLSRLQTSKTWIVDPIDGTREFSRGIPEYAISVALVENHVPILSCIYNPATQELFHAIAGQGAYLNGQLIICKQSSNQKIHILVSNSEYSKGKWQPFISDYQVEHLGSIAYKLALVASGKADATLSLGYKNEWDIAAGVLLIQEAGGSVFNKNNQLIKFNQPNTLVHGIIAGNKQSVEKIFTVLSDKDFI